MEKRSITDFLNKEYKEYSFYTIENRALMSVIDGLKPVNRKVLFVSNNIWKKENTKHMKVFQLAGAVANMAFYHHGNISLENCIINMCQKFKNNLQLLDGDGIFGSLRSPVPGASRYIGAKLSNIFSLIYKDFELLEHNTEEGNIIEPNFYLPIIPMIIVSGSPGIAVGHASNILNRDPIDIINACISILNNRKIKNILPKINEFNGEWINDIENNKRWIIKGKYEIHNKTLVKITELPPSITYENYEKYLDKLCDVTKTADLERFVLTHVYYITQKI